MRRSVRSALGALATIVLLAAPALASATQITIVHVNDTHSHLDAVGPKDANLDGTLGGLAKAAGVIGYLKATSTNALFVHAGDLFQGDLYFYAPLPPYNVPLLSIPEMQMLAGLGLDVMTVGNHELFLEAVQPGTLAQVISTAFGPFGPLAPTVLSANLNIAAAGLTGLVQPNVVKTIDGVNVGFFGMTAIDYLSQGSPFLGYTPEAFLQIAAAQVSDLRTETTLHPKADVVVFVSHLGLALDEAIAANVPGIDAIVGGHDHAVAYEPDLVTGPGGKEVPIVRAGEYYKWVGALTLSVEGGTVSLANYQLVPVDASIPRYPAVADVVNQLKLGIDSLYGEDFWHQPIGYALADVSTEVDPASPARDSGIGDLVTDALRAKGGTEIALTVAGFFTEGLTHGFIVGDDAFRIVADGIDPTFAGLGFPLYKVQMTGENLLAALETTLGAGGDFFVHVSGMSYKFDSRKPAGRQLVAAFVGGQGVHKKQLYSVTVNLGVVQGLSAFPNVQLAGPPEPLGVNEYPAVRDWIAAKKVLLYFPQGRILDLAKLE